MSYSVRYVSQTGSNSNSGAIDAPMRSGAQAYMSLGDGGTIYFADDFTDDRWWVDGTETGLGGYQLTIGQGRWLSGNLNALSPGFLPLKSVVFDSYGGALDAYWGPVGCTSLKINSGVDRTKPATWMVRTSQTTIKDQNLAIQAMCPSILSCDFIRDHDKTIKWSNVTSAARVPNSAGVGLTTFTLDRSTFVGCPLYTIERSAGVVKVRFHPADAPPLFPIIQGTWWVIDSASPQWARGAVQGGQGVMEGADVAFTYSDDKTVPLSSGTNTYDASTKSYSFSGMTFTADDVGGELYVVDESGGQASYNGPITSVTNATTVVCSGATGLISKTITAGRVTRRAPDVSTTTSPGVTIRSHFVLSNNYGFDIDKFNFETDYHAAFVEFQTVTQGFSNGEFLEAMYQVAAVTADTITVLDPWGDYLGRHATASASNPGRIVAQERFLSATNAYEMNNCHLQFNGGTEGGIPGGPLVNIGSGAAISPKFTGCTFLNAYYPEPNLAAAAIMSGGVMGTVGLEIRNTKTIGANFRLFPAGAAGDASLYVDNLLQDSDFAHPLRPAIEVLRDAFGAVINVNQADSVAQSWGLAVNRATGRLISFGCSVKPPPVAPAPSDANAYAVTLGSTKRWQDETRSLDSQRFSGWQFNDGHVAGLRDDVAAAFGVVQNLGLSNLLNPDLSTWSVAVGTGAATATPGQADPIGGTGAWQIACTSGVSPLFGQLSITVPAAVAGDHVIFGAWFRALDGGKLVGEPLVSVGFADLNPEDMIGEQAPFGGDGNWYFVRAIGTVPSYRAGLTRLLFGVRPKVSHPFLIYLPALYYLPVSAYGPEEAFRRFNTLVPRPTYLQPGSAGTHQNVKLIGHGGIGSTVYNVGAAAGQVTLGSTNGKAVPWFNPDGTVAGWLPLLGGTVNT